MKPRFMDVKRFVPALAAVMVLALFAWGQVQAKSDPFVGTWKLNVAKSTYKPGPPPKDQTRVWEASGKVDVTGTSAAGKPTEYGYDVNFSHPVPVAGAVGSGGDTVSFKRINSKTVEANYTMRGKHVETARMKVSADGKIMQLSAKGVLPDGTPFDTEAIWEKQ